ncbi:MAG: hypothetical protein IKN16_13010 [Selenomonadaceae bacterium]|nr:hypothetical protein [Selenomonadaceae bacterium]MBR6889343.1 hypothetical protein [Selenomonadaceae bacterium]
MIERLKKFFRADTGEIISAYFEGEKISRECRQRGWKTSLVVFCLREGGLQ